MTNPTVCPYTLEDIQSCKDITLEEVKKDYKNLIDFKADTNPKKFCGNKVLYQYQFRNLLKCRREKQLTIEEIFESKEEIQKLWDETIKRNRRDKDPTCSATDMYECFRINRGAIVLFKSSTAKYIYKLFQAKSVLDPTAGWGGRMLGAASLGIKYFGMDLNKNLRSGYDKMRKDLNISRKECRMYWGNCLKADFSKIDYDLVLTSPPYVNMEIYEGSPYYKNDNYFYEKFLIPLMNKCFEHLKIGGHMCFNISPKMFKKLMTYKVFWNSKEPHMKIDLRQQLGKNHVTKSQDYIYVWSKKKVDPNKYS